MKIIAYNIFIMYIRFKKSTTGKMTAVQLVEGARDAATGKVKQRVVRHIGSADNDSDLGKLKELGEYLKFELEGRSQPNLFTSEAIIGMAIKGREAMANQNLAIDDIGNLREEQRNIVGVHDIYGRVFDNLGFNKVLNRSARQVYASEIIRNIVLARIANPASKRSSVSFLENNYGINLKLDAVYRSMKKIDEQVIERIQAKALHAAQGMLKEKIDVLFYDATTLYFESFTEDELRSNGYSKDNKFNQVQVLLTIFVTSQGIPVGYEVFLAVLGHTLLTSLASLKQRYDLDKIVFVADSGMLNADNINLLEQEGYRYIVGGRIKNMDKSTTSEILKRDDYTKLELGSESYEAKVITLKDDKKLIVSYSDKRAYKDKKDRNTALLKLQKKLNKSKAVKSLIGGSGYKKYLKIQGSGNIEIDEQKFKSAALWDGLHGVITNIPNPNVAEILHQYKGLWQVEETFRITKHDLKVRPMFHWNPQKIKAHIAICFMALVVIRNLEHRINLQREKMSPERIRKVLTSVQISVVRHIKDQRLIAIPSRISEDAKIIYKTFDLKLSQTPYLL
jgi:transposase